jgi:hypothetical protein
MLLFLLWAGMPKKKTMEKTKPDTYQLAEVLFMNAWGHNPKADVQDLITRALEAAIAYDERIELLKHAGLVSIGTKVEKDAVTTAQVVTTPDSEPAKAKPTQKEKRGRRGK